MEREKQKMPKENKWVRVRSAGSRRGHACGKTWLDSPIPCAVSTAQLCPRPGLWTSDHRERNTLEAKEVNILYQNRGYELRLVFLWLDWFKNGEQNQAS